MLSVPRISANAEELAALGISVVISASAATYYWTGESCLMVNVGTIAVTATGVVVTVYRRLPRAYREALIGVAEAVLLSSPHEGWRGPIAVEAAPMCLEHFAWMARCLARDPEVVPEAL